MDSRARASTCTAVTCYDAVFERWKSHDPERRDWDYCELRSWKKSVRFLAGFECRPPVMQGRMPRRGEARRGAVVGMNSEDGYGLCKN